jgi:hypothetical protein
MVTTLYSSLSFGDFSLPGRIETYGTMGKWAGSVIGSPFLEMRNQGKREKLQPFMHRSKHSLGPTLLRLFDIQMHLIIENGRIRFPQNGQLILINIIIAITAIGAAPIVDRQQGRRCGR